MDDKKIREKRSRRIKPFDELTITDDFIFGAVMSDPKRCKKLLEYILNIKISRIDYREKQKTIDISYDSKGVRLEHKVKSDEKWRNGYMNLAMKLNESRLEGRRIGDYCRMVSSIRVLRNSLNEKQLMEAFFIDEVTLENIFDMIDNYPDWTDEDIAYELCSDDDNG